MSKNRSTKSLLLGAILAAFAAAPVVAWADDAAPPPVNGGDISFTGSTNFTNAYYFRGFLNQNQGLIVQPAASMAAKVYEGKAGDLFSNFTLNGGIWTSFHGTPYANPTLNKPDSWYEADLSVGASVAIMDRDILSFTYIDYTSPNGGFNETQELDLSLKFNDAGLWADTGPMSTFSMTPYFTFAMEVAGTAKPSYGGPSLGQGTYEEFGITPSMVVIDSKDYPVTLSVPIVVGLSVDNYYVDAAGNDKFFGYVSFGPVVSVPLAFISSKYGTWTASAGYTFSYLGEGVRDANVFNTGNTADYAHVVTAGLSFTY